MKKKLAFFSYTMHNNAVRISGHAASSCACWLLCSFMGLSASKYKMEATTYYLADGFNDPNLLHGNCEPFTHMPMNWISLTWWVKSWNGKTYSNLWSHHLNASKKHAFHQTGAFFTPMHPNTEITQIQLRLMVTWLHILCVSVWVFFFFFLGQCMFIL